MRFAAVPESALELWTAFPSARECHGFGGCSPCQWRPSLWKSHGNAELSPISEIGIVVGYLHWEQSPSRSDRNFRSKCRARDLAERRSDSRRVSALRYATVVLVLT